MKTNKLLAITASAVLVFSLAFSSSAEITAAKQLGDVTGDGVINTADALEILQYSVGKRTVFSVNSSVVRGEFGDVYNKSVTIELKPEYSTEYREFTATDFSEVDCEKIESVYYNHFFVDSDSFRQIDGAAYTIIINIKQPGVQAIKDAIEILEAREDVLNACPVWVTYAC